MSTKTFATELRKTISSLKEKQGVTDIKCDNLIAYLDNVIISSEGEEPGKMERYNAELQLWVNRDQAEHASHLEMFRSVILAGQNALKTAFLMNGGATVAILAFLGKLSDHRQEKIADFASALVFFVIGVLAITMASGGTYLSQWFYAGSESWKKKTGFWLNILVIIFGLASYGLFIVGTIIAYKAFIGFV